MFFAGLLDPLGCLSEVAYHWSPESGELFIYLKPIGDDHWSDKVDCVFFDDLEDAMWYVESVFRTYANGHLLAFLRDDIWELRYRPTSDLEFVSVHSPYGEVRRMVHKVKLPRTD